MTQSPEENPLPIADNGREPAKVIVHTKDGRALEAFKQHARGVLQNPLTEDEMWVKFDDCVDGIAMSGRAADIQASLKAFEALDHVGELMRLLRSPH